MRRIPRNPRIIRALVIIFILSISLYTLVSQYPRVSKDQDRIVSRDWKSGVTGWYNRSTIVTDTSHIHFTSLFDFQLIHTTSNWGSERLGVAFFDEDYCITPKAVLKMNHTDYVAITKLIAIVRARNSVKRHYSMNPEMSDSMTFSIHVAGNDGNSQLYSVYGFERNGVDRGSVKLPEELWELFGVVAQEEVGGWESEGEDFVRLKEELGTHIRGMTNVGKHYGPGDDH